MVDFLRGENGEGIADVLRATGAADAMDVILGMPRHVEIDDVGDAGDVEAARGDVGRDHHFIFAAAETFEGLDALALRAVRVQRGHGVLLSLEPDARLDRP